MELLPKRRLECVIHLMKGNHLNLMPHLFVVFPFSLECTLWNHCFHCTLLSFYPFPSLCSYNVIFCYISLCAFALLFHLFFYLMFIVVTLDDLEYEVKDIILSTWHSIVQLKKVNSKTFINSKKTCSISLWWAIFALLFTLFATIMKKDKLVLGVEHLDYGCELQLTNWIM
jgi:hypothetical protein